ncbi:MATE family efflux transporter [Oceanotoga teriensis]|uniref:MATE family efflux protein n=1 Tax=Oceanotoga teriensis TaxID=515440 RepID=A0AA45C8C4_9BACT|nr:MATE family efflux transporter [Oceanotoga teriensis]MDO7976831.1 MATE family efflux transporter [Oceanotoga teriensis]PWJ95908.1 putative MATE family efflux protein [Oceanotoga teriensis]
MKDKKVDLTNSNIFKSLVKLSLPIVGTSFLQMAYNLTDIYWIGKMGSNAVAAVGTAGFFMWFSNSLSLMPKTGSEITVSQSVGKNDMKNARLYAQNALTIGFILALIYSVFLIIFKAPLINFFNIPDKNVVESSIRYLNIVSYGMIFAFINPVFTGILNGYGDSTTPFKYNTYGLFMNIILDPLFIYGFKLYEAGAAYATVLSQMFVFILFLYKVNIKGYPLNTMRFFRMPDKIHALKIIKLGFPVALQNGLFAFISMNIARIISQWGAVAIAVQKVGAQIESISWMTAGGIATALSSFTGQNYGANKPNRILKGYFSALTISMSIGAFATMLFLFLGDNIFALFIPGDFEAIFEGADYLRIQAYSQILMTIEITTMGAFNGLGNTIPPSLVSIIFTSLRIPIAIFLSNQIGLNGVWWTISLTSMLKGIVIAIWFAFFIKKFLNKKCLNNSI